MNSEKIVATIFESMRTKVILFLCLLLISCASSDKSAKYANGLVFHELTITPQSNIVPIEQVKAYFDYRHLLSGMFQQAYGQFINGNSDSANIYFSQLVGTDTGMIQYEAYPFLAENYHKIGKDDLGLTLYKQAFEKAQSLMDRKGATIIDSIRFDSISSWKSQFPSFPLCLQSENGFLPYDKFPFISNGGSIKYSMDARFAGHSGGCWVDFIIDESGHICRWSILQSAGEAVDNSVIESCKKWQFMPGFRKGNIAKTEFPFYYDVSAKINPDLLR